MKFPVYLNQFTHWQKEEDILVRGLIKLKTEENGRHFFHMTSISLFLPFLSYFLRSWYGKLGTGSVFGLACALIWSINYESRKDPEKRKLDQLIMLASKFILKESRLLNTYHSSGPTQQVLSRKEEFIWGQSISCVSVSLTGPWSGTRQLKWGFGSLSQRTWIAATIPLSIPLILLDCPYF